MHNGKVLQQFVWGQRCRKTKLCWVKISGTLLYPQLCSANKRMPYESLWPLERDSCASILRRAAFWNAFFFFSESFHYWGREAVQSFPAQQHSRAPSGPGPPAVPGWRLDSVQGSGTGGAAKTQRPLQQEIVLLAHEQWFSSSDLQQWYCIKGEIFS